MTVVAGLVGFLAAVFLGLAVQPLGEFSPEIIGLVIQMALAAYWAIQFVRAIRKRPIPRFWAAIAGAACTVLLATTVLTWSVFL